MCKKKGKQSLHGHFGLFSSKPPHHQQETATSIARKIMPSSLNSNGDRVCSDKVRHKAINSQSFDKR